MKKKSVKVFALLMAMTFILTGCGGKKAPDEWYAELLQYYKDGFADEWKHEKDDFVILDDMKDPKNKFGYLMKDLDGDGNDELLIGIIDDSKETKFTDICIWHWDFGANRSMFTGDGYYYYICDNGLIKEECWRGSETEIRYMKYDGAENSFPIVDTEGTPAKFELTPLN